MFHSLLSVVVFVGLSFPALGDELKNVVKEGGGSYSLVLPEGCKPLPERIFRTPDMKGAVPTNQWWSSVVWQEFSANLFPHPLAMVATAEGLAVCYPGSAIVASEEAIMGGGVTPQGDFVIGHSGGGGFPAAECGGHSDWFVKLVFKKNGEGMMTSFGHGSPFVFCEYEGGEPVLKFDQKPVVWAGNAGEPVLGVTVKGNHYGLFGAEGSTWDGLDGQVFSNKSGGKTYFSIALLPDDKPETLALFRKYAYRHVNGTRLTYEVSGGYVNADYRFTTKAWEGGGSGTLFAMYPHQWKCADAKLSGRSYQSVRGEMKLGEGDGFSTKVPVQGVLPMLPAEGIADRERMSGYLRKEASLPPAEFKDTYWEGKHLGSLATLSGIAEVMGETELRDGFVNEIRRRLEAWFTVEDGKSAPLFYYNANWGTLIGNKPSYGSDMPINDHHFHYGYFIRAAAEVVRVQPEWAEKWGPMVRLLIRDIASPDREDAMFPFLRCFDRYAGHSWASGDANFADGNNQESSSESMNAWYGMMLWGEVTKDELIRDTGTFLFNTERTAIEEYWFDVDGTNFPQDFPQVALGMVWGGKGAFATWFSPDIDCIHGINWLPFTPASLHMGRHPEYVKKNHDRIVEKRKDGADYNTGWGDLILMFNALQDPGTAVKYLDANPDCKLEGGNTHAFMHHWVHTLSSLGLNDAEVTADHPFNGVFNKGGRRSYVVYNFGEKSIAVKFSDGQTVLAAPGRLTVSAGGS